MPGLSASLLRFLRRASAVLVLQHVLILLQQVLGDVEDRASPGVSGVAAAPTSVLAFFLRVLRVLVAVLRVVLVPLVEHARPTGSLEQTVPSSL